MNARTDNRWSPGASGAEVPADAPAAYSARWIDLGDSAAADVLPDRQGFAYDSAADRELLLHHMGEAEHLRSFHHHAPHDECIEFDGAGPSWRCCMRRSGGYVYVDAWLVD